MTKSFRNLILSLFLAIGAAGFTACSDGNMGPAGEAGPAGAAGPAGPKGVPGEAGKSFEELPRKYKFLETWGKADGMIACNDASIKNMDPFPGPAALTKTSSKAGPPADRETPMIPVGTMPGDCSSDLFLAADPFTFVQDQAILADLNKPEQRRGTTSNFGNPALTDTFIDYYGGTVTVRFKQSAAEIMEREVLFDRCGVGKGPASSGAGKSIAGEYRMERLVEYERLLERGTDGIFRPKPDASVGGNTVTYVVAKFRTRICVRFSAPGTVKCYEKTDAQKRNPDGSSAGSSDDTRTEQVALYKNGQMTLVAPMPVNGKLAGKGTGGGGTGGFPFGDNRFADNIPTTGKLCNLFAGGVVPCGPNTSPNSNGDGGCS